MTRLLLASVAVVAAMAQAGSASAATCNVGFDQSTGMRSMPASQAYGIAHAPYYSAVCAGANFVKRFTLDENGADLHGHYHFWAQDPTVNCFTTNATWPDGVMGRKSGAGPCVAVDPYATPRDIGSHSPTHRLRLRATAANNWRPRQILVKGTVAIRVLVEHTDGTWWQYVNLTPGLWNLGITGKFARNVWMFAELPNGGPIWFDNLLIDHNL